MRLNPLRIRLRSAKCASTHLESYQQQGQQAQHEELALQAPHNVAQGALALALQVFVKGAAWRGWGRAEA